VFEWDTKKEADNIERHGVNFETAQRAFLDENRLIAKDEQHSEQEPRYFCIGKVDNEIMTVRFTYRNQLIRIIGAGQWRKGKKQYEQANG